MDCADAKLRMEPYATGNLASPDREEFEKHIADCEGCRLELDLVRAGVTVSRPEEAAPAEGFVRSGDSGFAPGGVAFGAASGLDETSFADVASQLAQESPAAPADFERSGQPGLPADADAPPAAGPPPGEFAQAFEIPSPVPAPAPPPVPEPSFGPVAAPPLGSGAQDYSLDALLADAAPAQPGEPEPPPPAQDPLAQVLPPEGPASAPGVPKSLPGIPKLTPMGAPRAQSSWEFEPVEAERAGAPPEGSLFFAEETLARARGGGRRKGGAVRLALWVAGSALGVALLVFAGWIALHHRPSDETARVVAEQYAAPPDQGTGGAPVEGSAAGPESPEAAAPAEPAPEAAPPEAGAPSQSAPQAAETSPRPTPEEAPLVSSASTVAPRSPLPEASATEPSPKPAPARKAPERGTKAQSTRARPAGESGAPAAKRSARTGGPGGSPAPVAAAPRGEAETPAAAREPVHAPAGTPRAETSATTVSGAGDAERPAPVEPGSRTAEPGAIPSPAPAAPERAPAVEAPTPGAHARGEGASPEPAPAAPEAAKPSGGGTAAATAPTPEPPAPAEESPAAPQRPIDRLHLATVAAEQRGDLRALRSMRDAWKTFIQKSGVGPDRIRAKRELADCLWAIQGITGRRSDQQEALRAYRDYLLNAPAGGADSRTVGRAKLLQDAVSESN